MSENSEEMVAVTPEQIAEALGAVNQVLVALEKRIRDVEKYVSELPTPAKTFYKPDGYDDYMNLKENFDELYRRVERIENGM
tara:strand:- start:80 stop:325 length:246 start_codon:yes stop_codon:yes gene_type:complete